MLNRQPTVVLHAFDEELVSIGVEELRANGSNVWEACGNTASNDRCRNKSSERDDL